MNTDDWCVWLKEYKTQVVSSIATKNKELCCPECSGELTKKKDTGEGVKHCEKCGSGWFILKTSRGNNE